MEKIEVISIAKGIGIILMVIGHAEVPYVLDFIYMFHMPLFFVLSGYCFKEKYLTDFKSFALRRVMGLYFPFLKWGLVFLALHNVLFYLNIYNDQYGYAGSVSHLYTVGEFARHGIIGCGLFLYSEQLLGGYWFLAQLFWASLIGFAVIRFVKRPIYGATLLLILCFLVKYFVNKTIPYTGIGSITLMSSSFIVYGYVLRKSKIELNALNASFVITAFIVVLVGSFYWNTTMQDFTYLHIFPYAFTAILGSMMVMSLSFTLSKKLVGTSGPIRKILILAGDNTLVILTWHFLCFKMISLFIISIEGMPIQALAMFPVIKTGNLLYLLLYVFVGVGMPLCGLKLYERFAQGISKIKLIIQAR